MKKKVKVAKLSDESKAILKEIRGLKKQEHEALKKADKKDLPIILALLNPHKPSHSPRPLGKKPQNGGRGRKSTGKGEDSTASGEATATSASA
uniref:Uncharacterized protein n=1 Tax=Panagrolaimus sp. ES5 TaxID=591445 RepID=A0AC34G1C2_9BILA